MKPYIMYYSETIDISNVNLDCSDYTEVTKMIENSDDDMINQDDYTYVTESIEPSDEDFLSLYDTTATTRAVEPSDEDF